MSRLSPVTRRYVGTFLFRLAVFLLIGWVYLTGPERLDVAAYGVSWPLAVLWGAVLTGILSQLNVRSGLTTGCLKHHPSRFDPVPGFDREAAARAVRAQNKGAGRVAALWIAVNLCLGALYGRRVIRGSCLVLLCAFFYLCDLICVLFFCPFQTFLMHNRCCVNCRIFAWGSWMMTAPLAFIPHWYTWSLCAAALLVLAVWEVRLRRYPERFWHGSNRNLQCGICREQLCCCKRALAGWARRRT